MYRMTRSRSQYIMFVGALSTMARETVSNAKGAGSETAGPWVRAEAEVWLLVLLIAAGDLRPQGSMLRMRVASSTACERESERSGHCALPWNLSASPGTALRESSGRVDVPERFRRGPSVAFADSRRADALERAAGPGDPCPWSRQASAVEHQLHDVVVGACRRVGSGVPWAPSGLTIPSAIVSLAATSLQLWSRRRGARSLRCANGVLCATP